MPVAGPGRPPPATRGTTRSPGAPQTCLTCPSPRRADRALTAHAGPQETSRRRETALSTAEDARPTHLAGHYAPVPDEIDAVDLPVEGTLPPELDGRYVRNGPNPLPGDDPGHWFRGHGMLHGVRLQGGRAHWYRNRWVRTGALAGRRFLTWRGVDLTAVPANTHVIEHGGRLLALVEQGLPYEVDRDLGTVGPCDFGGRLRTAMTAHPKTDPDTGELHFYGYSPVPPYLTYHRVSAAGELVVSRRVKVRRPTLMHDAAITARHVVWLDLPLTFSLRRMATGFPFGWDESYGARLGVMRHDDPTATVRWFEIDPCYVFHVGTAHEDALGADRARRGPLHRRGHGDRLVRAPAPGGLGSGGRGPGRRGRGARRLPDAPLDARPGHRRRRRDPAARPARWSSRRWTRRGSGARRATATP